MTWIESHTDLADHPKLYDLADRLDIDEVTAIGHLHLLWWFAIHNAENGQLQIPERAIARAMRWKGSPEDLVGALVDAHWLDVVEKGYEIHDWKTYAGKLLDRRKKDRERKRNPSAGNPTDDARNSAGFPNDDARRSGRTRNPLPVTQPSTGPNRPPDPTAPESEDGGARWRADRPALQKAFAKYELQEPFFGSRNKQAAEALLRHYTPEQIASTFQAIRDQLLGDAFDREHLTFGNVARHDLVRAFLLDFEDPTPSPNGHVEVPA